MRGPIRRTAMRSFKASVLGPSTPQLAFRDANPRQLPENENEVIEIGEFDCGVPYTGWYGREMCRPSSSNSKFRAREKR